MASSCSRGQLENEYVEERRDKVLPLECIHFPNNPRLTKNIWHLSNYFWKCWPPEQLCLHHVHERCSPYRIYQKQDPFYLQFGFLYPTQMEVNNQTHKVNRTKMLHTIDIYLFVQHHFHRTNPLVHIISRIQYAIPKLTSPYQKNYSYTVNSTFCEGPLCNFDSIIKSSLFSPLYAKTHRLIFVPIDYLQCVEGGAIKCMYEHTSMVEKLSNREPTLEEIHNLNRLLALRPYCIGPLSQNTRRLSCTKQWISGFLQGSWHSSPWFWNRIPVVGHKPTTRGSQTPCSVKTQSLLLFFLFLLFLCYHIHFLYWICPFLLCVNWRLESVLFFFSPVRVYSSGTKLHWKFKRISSSHSS